jgi:uncharacterized protein YbjT (DUF2867 family)
MKTAIIAGASGLVGKQLLYQLIESNQYTEVIVLVRKPIAISSPILKQLVVNFDELQNWSAYLVGNDVFCCIGTTIKKAGSQANFKKIDYDYSLNLANITSKNGCENFFLISALGANANSKVFYNKVKGELEEALGKLNFKSLYCFQPSLLLGNRTEFRLGEKLAQIIFKPISKILIFFGAKKYAAITDIQVAKAMLYYAQKKEKGNHKITNEMMLSI